MKLIKIEKTDRATASVMRRRNSAGLLAAASRGDGDACHALGVTLSTGDADRRELIEAHKWFNLGALYGCEEAALSRAEIAAEMTRGEVAEAQRRAREWLSADLRRAA